MKLHCVCFCVTSCFQIDHVFSVDTWCSMYQFFLLLLPDNFPLCDYTMFDLSIHQLVDIWIISTFCIIWIMLLWTLVYKFLCGHVCSFLGCVYIGVELLGYMVTVYILFNYVGTTKLFPKVTISFYSLSKSIWWTQFLLVLTGLFILFYF